MTEGALVGIRDILDANPVVGEMRRGSKQFWTTREERILREHYPLRGVHGCLHLLPGRSASAIYRYATLRKLRAPEAIAARKRWTTNPQIDAAIARVYQGDPKLGEVKRLAQTLNRPQWWISLQAARLGVAVPRFRAANWSDREIEIIKEMAGRTTRVIAAALAREGFKRTPSAIGGKLVRCGVSLRHADPDRHTAADLARLFGLSPQAVLKWIDKGWLKAKQDGGGDHRIKRKDVRAFVIDNPGAVDLRKVDKFWFIEMLGVARDSG